MFRFAPIKWSSCELDYLKTHLEDPHMQLAGYLGKSVNAIKNKIKEIVTGIVPEKKKRSSKNTKIGKRPDLGLFLRSGWEADYLRYLNFTIVDGVTQYEPQTFSFVEHGVKHGTMGYTPDFKVRNHFDPYYWVEVKGFLKAEDKTKLNRFKKFYPEEFAKLRAVCGGPSSATWKFFEKLGVKHITNFLDLKKQFKNIIPNWESQ